MFVRVAFTLVAGLQFAGVDVTASAAEVHIVHCLQGCPTGAPETNDLVVREIYALSSNDETKFADWVAYRVTSSTIGTSKDLNRGWQADPTLDESETLEEKDYKGASAELGVDRGHQAPLAAFANTVYWRDTNLLSNITPQKKALNQGPWRILEEAIRDAAYHLRELFVVTGPLYEREMKTMPGADEPHTVPSGYWKVVATSSGRIAAFVFDQDTSRRADYCAGGHESSVSDIERRAGLNLFPEAKAEWGRLSLRDALGC